MIGTLQRRRAVWALLAALACAAAAPAEAVVQTENALGKFELSGFARVQLDVHTANRNPNNDLPKNYDFQMFRQWLRSDVTWEPSFLDDARLFVLTRLWSDQTSRIEGDIRDYDAYPGTLLTDGFDGDEWRMRVSDDHYAAEIWELWFDYSIGPLYFRLGRQTIVWGDVAPNQLLDDTNPLDLSWHLLLEPVGKEIYDHLRIPLHALRVGYDLPFLTDHQLEGYVIPGFSYISTQLPSVDSPYNVVSLPAPLELEKDSISDGQRGVGAGVRMLGRFGDVNYTLNWMTRHVYDPLAIVSSCRLTLEPIDGPLDCGTLFDLVEAFPDLPPPPGVRVLLRLRHPRFDTVGFSGNYFIRPINTVTRVEFTWDIDRPFENLDTFNTQVIERHQWNYVVTFDRPSFLLRRDRTALILVQFQQRIREGGGGTIGYIGDTVDDTDELITVLFEQAWNNPINRHRDEFVTNMTTLMSTDNTYLIQPLLRYEPGNHWRFNVWYNLIIGTEDRPLTTRTEGRFNFIEFAQGVNFSVSYNF